MPSVSNSGGLPLSERVNVGKLVGLFKDTTNSYKFFFFLALLGSFRRYLRGDGGPNGIDSALPLTDLASDMAMLAWYPRVFCHLSLGSQDKLATEVERLPWSAVRGSWIQAEGKEWRRLKNEVRVHVQAQRILRFVPYRLIRPFFAAETAGLDDQQVNRKIEVLASSHFLTTRPLYKFTDDGSSLVFNHDWVTYITSNLEILDGWCKFKLAEYLQSRNPGVAGILEKIIPPTSRVPMTTQTKFWDFYLERNSVPVRSIYSTKDLVPGRTALDHFLPWSFVAHNRSWNLVPEAPEVNSSKSDRLPSLDYVRPLASLQFDALVSTRGTFAQWEDIWEPYSLDLGFTGDILTNKRRFQTGLDEYFTRLLAVAER